MGIDSSRLILLVEDEAIIAMSEAQILRRQGFEVRIVHDAESAIEAADAGDIDLVLMDIDLGRNRMDGTEAAEAILEKRELPVVFLSSHTEPEVVEKTEGITSYGYIVKHAGETVMIASVKMAFRLFEANQQVKKQEHALLESRERLRITLDSIGDAVIATDIGGRVTRMNRVAEALVGWTHEEAAGKPLSEVFTIVDAEARNPVADPVGRVIATGTKLELGNHTLLVSRSGNEYQISDSAAPIRAEDGSLRGVVLVFRDVTEEYRRNRQIAEARDFLEAVFTSVQDGISVLDRNLNVTYTNSVMEKWYARNTPLVGKKCFTVYHNRRHPCRKCPSIRCMQTGRTEVEEVPGSPDPESAVDSIELFSYPLRDPETGEITGVIEFVRDITERRRIERQLRESEERYRLAAEGTGDGLWDWNLKTNDAYYSDRFATMLGYRPDDLQNTGEAWTALLHPDDREEALRRVDDYLGGRAEHYEDVFRLRAKDGSYRWIVGRGKALFDENGTATRFVGFNSDVTEQKEREERIRRLLEEAERSQSRPDASEQGRHRADSSP